MSETDDTKSFDRGLANLYDTANLRHSVTDPTLQYPRCRILKHIHILAPKSTCGARASPI